MTWHELKQQYHFIMAGERDYVSFVTFLHEYCTACGRIGWLYHPERKCLYDHTSYTRYPRVIYRTYQDYLLTVQAAHPSYERVESQQFWNKEVPTE